MTSCDELKNLLQVALALRKKRGRTRNTHPWKKQSEMRERKKEKNVDNLLKFHLVSLDAVSQQHYLRKKSYIYKCPGCNGFIPNKLARHLENKHQYAETDAKFLQSKMRVLYAWCLTL